MGRDSRSLGSWEVTPSALSRFYHFDVDYGQGAIPYCSFRESMTNQSTSVIISSGPLQPSKHDDESRKVKRHYQIHPACQAATWQNHSIILTDVEITGDEETYHSFWRFLRGQPVLDEFSWANFTFEDPSLDANEIVSVNAASGTKVSISAIKCAEYCTSLRDVSFTNTIPMQTPPRLELTETVQRSHCKWTKLFRAVYFLFQQFDQDYWPCRRL